MTSFNLFHYEYKTVAFLSLFLICSFPGCDDAEKDSPEFGFSLRDHDRECLLLQQPPGQFSDSSHRAPTHAQLHPATALQRLVQSHHREGGLVLTAQPCLHGGVADSWTVEYYLTTPDSWPFISNEKTCPESPRR